MNFRIGVIRGDGIGPEVIAAAQQVLDTCAPWGLTWVPYEGGAAYYRKTGQFVDPQYFADTTLAATFFGAAGLPEVRLPNGTGVGVASYLRQRRDLYAGIRPIKSVPGTNLQLDFLLVREQSEGAYASLQGYRTDDVAVDLQVISRRGTQRVVRQAAQWGKRLGLSPRLTVLDKSNTLASHALFRETAAATAQELGLPFHGEYADAAAARLVQGQPGWAVVVTENLLGDVLSEIGAELMGGIGVAPSADVGDDHAMFQPIHGSAPDIAGRGVANPVGAMWSGALMLMWLGARYQVPRLTDAARKVTDGIFSVIRSGVRTPDLGGICTTDEVMRAVVGYLRCS